MTKPLPKIEPCPFCGKKCGLHDESLLAAMHVIYRWTIWCSHCAYVSSNYKTGRGAINAHNSVSKKARG